MENRFKELVSGLRITDGDGEKKDVDIYLETIMDSMDHKSISHLVSIHGHYDGFDMEIEQARKVAEAIIYLCDVAEGEVE